MKFHEAIRLGSMMGPQLYDKLFAPSIYDTSEGTCAMGAAMLSSGLLKLLYDSRFKSIVSSTFPIVHANVDCPACHDHHKPGHHKTGDADGKFTLWYVGMYLNDDHKWTRERIADWVQGIEDTQTVAQSNDQTITPPVEVFEESSKLSIVA